MLAWPLLGYIVLRYDPLDREVSVVGPRALLVGILLCTAIPVALEAQQPAKQPQRSQPAQRPAEPPRRAEPRAEPRTQAPDARREEPRRAEPAERPAPRSTGEPELKRRKPEG